MPAPSRGRRGGKKSKKTDEPDIEEDLPDVEDLVEGGESEGKLAKILLSELRWVRDHSNCDHDYRENDTCEDAPIKMDRNGRGMRIWFLAVAFDFCQKWQDPQTIKDIPYKAVKYFVSKAKTSDYGEARILLKKAGWDLKKVGELEDEWFIWFGTSENPDGTPREFENAAGEVQEWIQWFPMQYVPPDEYEAHGITG